MNNKLFTQKIILLIVVFLVFPLQSSFAGIYKCTDGNGITVYQAIPCTAKEKQKEFKNSKKRPPVKSDSAQCESGCDNEHLICVSNLKDGTWNADGGKSVCDKEKVACEANCSGADNKSFLKIDAYAEREQYAIKNEFKKRSDDRKKERRVKAVKRCDKAKNQLRKAKTKWEELLPLEKRRMSKAEIRFFLRKIEKAERDVRYDCD